MFKKFMQFRRRHSSLCNILAMVLFVVGFWFFLVLPDLLVPIFVKVQLFSHYNLKEISNTIFWFEMFLFIVISAILIFYFYYKKKKAFKQLEERKISDYVKKYPYYVNLVQNYLNQPKYEAITLNENWVKGFDYNLSGLVRHCNASNLPFYDFEIAATLLYVLTGNSCRGKNLYEFAFECAKEIISEPRSYDAQFEWDGELLLEVKEVFGKSADFSISDIEVSEQTAIAIIKTYLSQIKVFADFEHLANFLYILYLRHCK